MMDNYYKRKVYPYVVNLVEKLIDRKGSDIKIKLQDLDDNEISAFASLLITENIEELGDIVWQYNIYQPMTIALKSWDNEDKQTVAEKIMVNIITFFTPRMEEILEEVYNEIVNDFYSKTNPEVWNDPDFKKDMMEEGLL